MIDVYGDWVASAASVAAALTDTEVRAAAPAGKSHYITQIIFSNEGTANSFILEDTDGIRVYPPTGAVYLGANQTFNSGPLPSPIKVNAAVNINVTTTAADHSTTVVHGYTK